MFQSIGIEEVTAGLVECPKFPTSWPQLRGSLNTRIGKVANRAVFEIIQQIVSHAVLSTTESRLELRNASGRKVIITFSADPDISIFEEISVRTLKHVVDIEVKGREDKS